MRVKRIMSFVIILSIVLCSSITFSGATVLAKAEEKVFSTATLEDDFADNQVIVIMKNATSLKFNEYTASDFPEISCSKVVDIMPSMTESAKSMHAQINSANTRGTTSVDSVSDLGYEININDYHQILCLDITTPGKQNVLAAIKALETRSDILCAEPNYIITFDSVTVNDQYFSQQWAANKIKLQQAWNITTGSSSIHVGVIDTGIDGYHPDLVSNVTVSLSRDCRSGTAVPVQHVSHEDPHGTLVAGVIGAAGNSIGISGVCRNVSLVSLQVDLTYSDEIAEAFMTSIVAAIDYAASTLDDNNSSNDIRILNCSFGVPSNPNISSMNLAIEEYGESGGLVVCSAGNISLGNEQPNNDINPHYPSNLSSYQDYVITVAASTSNDQIWSYSHYGVTTVDIFAPGASILSCHPTYICDALGLDCMNGHYSSGYHSVDGTSLAAPHVTGVAALMLTVNPSLEAWRIKEIIIDSADTLSAFNGLCVSGGRLNAYQAVLDASLD